MVTLSSISSSATEMPDIEMSPDVSSDDSVETVLEDLDDEPIVKARVSNSDYSSTEEVDIMTQAIALYSLPFSFSFYNYFYVMPISPFME